MSSSVDTRQRLIDAAQSLIYASSYREVGVQQICEQAEVKKGSFYHFFPSKRDLALAAMDQSLAFAQDAFINDAFIEDIAPLARINRFFEALYVFHKGIKESTGFILGCPFGNIGCEMSAQDEVLRLKADNMLAECEQPFVEALNAAVNCGDLPQMDTESAACALFAYVEGIMVYAKTRNDPDLISDLGKRALCLLMPAGLQ